MLMTFFDMRVYHYGPAFGNSSRYIVAEYNMISNIVLKEESYNVV